MRSYGVVLILFATASVSCAHVSIRVLHLGMIPRVSNLEYVFLMENLGYIYMTTIRIRMSIIPMIEVPRHVIPLISLLYVIPGYAIHQ
jgi:hypothetical protein